MLRLLLAGAKVKVIRFMVASTRGPGLSLTFFFYVTDLAGETSLWVSGREGCLRVKYYKKDVWPIENYIVNGLSQSDALTNRLNLIQLLTDAANPFLKDLTATIFILKMPSSN